jgi:hypothetical protein
MNALRHRTIVGSTKASNASNPQVIASLFLPTSNDSAKNGRSASGLVACLSRVKNKVYAHKRCGLLIILMLLLSAAPGCREAIGDMLVDAGVLPPRECRRILELPQGKQIKICFRDVTMNLSKSIDRPWVQYHLHANNNNISSVIKKMKKPELRLILTDFGWNHPNPKTAIQVVRLKRSRELLQAFINHPYFDPTFQFTTMANNKTAIAKDASVTNIVMLDLETCFETNYPVYNNSNPMRANADTQGDRPYGESRYCPCWSWKGCSFYINKVLQSHLFQQSPTSTLIFIDCGAEYHWRDNYPASLRRTIQTSHQLAYASISATYGMIREDTDMGLPPPAVYPVTLSDAEEHDIETCQADTLPDKRNFFLSFIGADRYPVDHGTREALFQLNQIDQGILLMDTKTFEKQYKGKHTFATIARASKFAATPRGEGMFTYRFTEVLSAGAIPVVHADFWCVCNLLMYVCKPCVELSHLLSSMDIHPINSTHSWCSIRVLPFRKELVDWTQCAVVIPEKGASETLEILRSIPDQKRCQMRQKCYQIYQKYMATPEGIIAGIVDSVLAQHNMSVH